MNSRAGAPRQSGERFPSGKLKPKPAGEPIAPAAWARLRTDVVKLTGDARLASQVGRLSFHRQLTDKQTVTAFRIGEIYGAYERFKGKRRSTRSPSYEMGFGGSDGIAEELMDAETLAQLEARIRAAETSFLTLQDELESYPRAARAALEQLCVEDCAINPMHLNDIAGLLDRVSKSIGETGSKKRRRRIGQARARASAAPAPSTTTPPAPARRTDKDKTAWLAFMHAMRPDLDDKELQAAHDFFVAMKDREQFNRGKRAAK